MKLKTTILLPHVNYLYFLLILLFCSKTKFINMLIKYIKLDNLMCQISIIYKFNLNEVKNITGLIDYSQELWNSITHFL